VVDVTPMVLENLPRLRLDSLIAIGGDYHPDYGLSVSTVTASRSSRPQDDGQRRAESKNTWGVTGHRFSTARPRRDSITRRVTTVGSARTYRHLPPSSAATPGFTASTPPTSPASVSASPIWSSTLGT